MIQTLKFIYLHPFNEGRRFKAILDFLIWQIKSRIWNKYYLYQFTESSKLMVKSGMTGATGNIYTGLHEFADMGVFRFIFYEK
ncbi:MAG: hypothetical protein IPO98_06950 [Saprospiraceae bacterium]|nr:hypothetical protein [Saprospiraceae bacterium]